MNARSSSWRIKSTSMLEKLMIRLGLLRPTFVPNKPHSNELRTRGLQYIISTHLTGSVPNFLYISVIRKINECVGEVIVNSRCYKIFITQTNRTICIYSYRIGMRIKRPDEEKQCVIFLFQNSHQYE